MTDYKYFEMSELVTLARRLSGIEFYAFKLDDKTTRLCARVVNSDTPTMSKERAEKLADDLNNAIRPILKQAEKEVIDKIAGIMIGEVCTT